MMNILVLVGGENNENTYCGDLDDRVKGFEVVKSHLLTDTLGDKVSFIVINCAIVVNFELIHPFAVENVHMRLMRNEEPSMVME